MSKPRVTHLPTNANENKQRGSNAIADDFVAIYRRLRLRHPEFTRRKAIQLALFEMDPRIKKKRFTMAFKLICDNAEGMLRQEGINI